MSAIKKSTNVVPRKPHFLYHGTLARHVDSIKKNGILPRRKLGTASNYQGRVESKLDLVYLSTIFPVFYALNASPENDQEDIAIVKVATSSLTLFPDEDFVARARLHVEGRSVTNEALADQSAIEDPSESSESAALLSLTHMGLAATGSIDPEFLIDTKVIPTSGKGNHLILDCLGYDTNPPARFGLPPAVQAEIDGMKFFFLAMLFREGLETVRRHVQAEIEAQRPLSLAEQAKQDMVNRDKYRRYYVQNFENVYFGKGA